MRLFRRAERHWLTPNVWQARDEWMARAAREAMKPQLAEIRALTELTPETTPDAEPA